MARHNVYAYILRQGGAGAAGRVRYSDDGEPQKTAGLPTLEVLQHAGLTDVVCVVTRYFGGVLLGTGGLVRAYTQSTQAGIDAAQLVVVSRCVDLRIRIAYPRYEQLMRLAEDHGAKVLSTDFADAVTMNLRMLDGTRAASARCADGARARSRGRGDKRPHRRRVLVCRLQRVPLDVMLFSMGLLMRSFGMPSFGATLPSRAGVAVPVSTMPATRRALQVF